MSQRHSGTATFGGERARLGTFRYTLKRIARHWQLYLVLLIPVVLLLIFSYGPMYGVQIAFKDFKVRQGIWGSKWVGMKHFQNFWGTYSFNRLITNTLTLSIYSLVAGFPIPILLALMLNECGNVKFKKTVQMITYAPHFISTVVMCASKLRRVWHIDLPGIIPTITILLILNVGSLMNIGYEKVLLLQNDLTMSASDIIATYVYRQGLENAQYSFSAAVGLFNSVVNTILLVTVNFITKKLGETSLF